MQSVLIQFYEYFYAKGVLLSNNIGWWNVRNPSSDKLIWKDWRFTLILLWLSFPKSTPREIILARYIVYFWPKGLYVENCKRMCSHFIFPDPEGWLHHDLFWDLLFYKNFITTSTDFELFHNRIFSYSSSHFEFCSNFIISSFTTAEEFESF